MKLNIKKLSIIYFSLNLICLLFFAFYNKTFWYDEAYSIGLIYKSFIEIWNITGHDVHPPLYYFILKVFASIFGYNLVSYHVCSLFGVFSMCLLGFFPIRRLWGSKTAFAFILLISILPITIYLGTEIRMYSWLTFFVLATAIYGYESYLKASYSSYIKFTTFAICASYTHNYGLVSALVIYAMLLLMSIRNKKKILPLAISSLVALGIFAFWVPNLYYQVTAVKESYWIQIFTINEFASYATFFFDPQAFGSIIKTISLIFFIIIFIALFTYIFKVNKKNIDKKRFYAISFFLGVFFLVLLSTATISFLFKPILVKRYLISVLGCLGLGIAIFVTSVDNRNRLIKSCGLIIISCLVTLYTLKIVLIYFHYKDNNNEEKILIEYFDKNIKSTNTEYSIVGSGYQKFLISILSLIKPESKYRYLFNEKDIAFNSWSSYPFDVDIIYSLENEPETVFSLRDINAATYGISMDKYQRSIDDLLRDEKTYYTTVKIDTIGIYEIKTLSRNLKNITNLDESIE